MNATFTIDGICYIIETTKDADVMFMLPGHMSEEVRIGRNGAQLLIAAFMAALAELEEDS